MSEPWDDDWSDYICTFCGHSPCECPEDDEPPYPTGCDPLKETK